LKGECGEMVFRFLEGGISGGNGDKVKRVWKLRWTVAIG